MNAVHPRRMKSAAIGGRDHEAVTPCSPSPSVSRRRGRGAARGLVAACCLRGRPPARSYRTSLRPFPYFARKDGKIATTRNKESLTPVHIYGAGGLGRETLDTLFALGHTAADLVFVDDHLHATELFNVPVRRPSELTRGAYVVAVADPAVRRTLSRRMLDRGLVPTSIVHPGATLAHDVRPADGCLVLANAFVSTGVRLAPHTQVHYNATVGHDALLDTFVTLLPGATVSGNVTLHSDVTVGCNASILPGLSVGARAVVGAGAVVTRDQPPDRVVVGVPAQQLSHPSGIARQEKGCCRSC